MACPVLPDANGRRSDQGSSYHAEDTASDCDTPPASEDADATPATEPTPPKATADNPKASDKPLVQQQSACMFAEDDDYDDDDDDDGDDDYYCYDDGGDHDGDYDGDYDGDHDYDRLGRGWGKVHLFMMPKLGTPECPTAPWIAVLAVKCRDVPRLMREGFFWSAENVVPEKGYMSNETRPRWTALGCRHRRTWILADNADDKTLRWVGLLDVVSPDLSLLADFQVKDLSRENVHAATATNAHQRWIYRYDHRYPRYNYNCVYDKKKLKGWWPWPREEGTYTAFPDLDAGELFPLPPVASSSCQEGDFDQPHQQPSSCVIL